GERSRQSADEALPLDAAAPNGHVADEGPNALPTDAAADVSLEQDPAPPVRGQRRPHLELEVGIRRERLLDHGAELLAVVGVDHGEELLQRVDSLRARKAEDTTRLVRPAYAVALGIPFPGRHARLAESVVDVARAGRERPCTLLARHD